MPLDAATDSLARKSMIDEIIRQGNELFNKRGNLLTLWQCLAEQFYPERADFTVIRTLGDDMAAHLMTSYPVVARRDLGNSFSAMLRPSAKPWFQVRSSRPDKEVTDARQWLEWATSLQRNAMYDPVAGFARATTATDHDFGCFGQAVIEKDLYRPRDGKTPHLLFRNWHLRDVAWCESVTGKIDTIYRRWKPTARELRRQFGDKIHAKVLEKLTQTKAEPYCEFNVWHVVLPSDAYRELPGAKPIRHPFVSIFIDVDNQHEMECVGQWTKRYTIPRWQTVSGSQYAHSPATVAALPDARLIQAVTLVLLEAGEKAVNPPTIATQDVVRSDISLYAGGTTWVDAEYDERLGEALRPMTIDKSGLQFALELVRDIRQSLRDDFFLSKLDMPPVGGPQMTAYEVGQRVQEYIRNALPLFEPMETEYNADMCDDVFTLLLMNSPEMRESIPKSIQGSEIRFQFESPLREASDRAKAGQFVEASQILATATQLDPTTGFIVDGQKATRDVLLAVAPADWLRTEDTVEGMIANQQQQQQQEKLLALMAQGTQIAKTGAEAAATASESLPGYGLS